MKRVAASLLALSTVAGCSGLTPYPNTSAGNLAVRTQMDSKARAVLHIHRVDASCQTEYQGTVQLDQPSTAVGIAPERFSYLVVSFESSSFMSGRSSTSVGTLLKPRAGYSYEFTVTYKESIYSIAIRETDPRKTSSREIARRDLRTCTD